MIKINGKTYRGNNLSMSNNKVYIDGKLVEDPDANEETKLLKIVIEGNVSKLEIDSCDSLHIIGDCESVTSKNGNIQLKGNVSGDVTSKNGNVQCGNVGGDVESKNGNVTYLKN